MPLSNFTLAEALDILQDHPNPLFVFCYVRIAGSAAANSGPARFAISVIAHNNIKKRGVTEDCQGFQIRYVAPAGVVFATELEFPANYIAMKGMLALNSAAGPAGTCTVLPAVGGHDLAITSQLTGCTFGIGSQTVGGACLVSHIQPTPQPSQINLGQSASQIEKQQAMLLQTGALHTAQAGALQKTFEQGTGYDDSASVIGKRDANGIWHFFTQPTIRTQQVFLDPVEL